MGWYRKRVKLALDCVRSLASRVSPLNEVFKRGSMIPRSGYYVSCSKGANFNGFSSISSISRRLVTRGGWFNRRFYCVDTHNNARNSRGSFRNLTFFPLVIVGSVILVTVHYGKLETTPYTNRTRFIVSSEAEERWLGKARFWAWKQRIKGEILPPTHPHSVRVRRIANDVVDALQRGLKKEQVWSDVDNASLEPATSHLDGLNWEVLVVDEPVVNAACFSGGKIVMFTGLLECLSSDAEIATIIGHEVAHAVAQHDAERLTLYLWFSVLQLILFRFFMLNIFYMVASILLSDWIFLVLPLNRRTEMEADYIGLLLTASAGYDPRIAPTLYEKLAIWSCDTRNFDSLSSHPLGKKRAELLTDAKIMEEALALYRDVREGRGV